MTIENYTTDRLDQTALRLFDLASDLRSIAREARRKGIVAVPVHDKKALLWIENLELWVRKSKANFEIAASETWQE